MIDEFVHAERNYVAVVEAIFLDLFLTDEYAVRAVQIFDNATTFVTDKLRMVAAHKFTLDVNLVIRRTADNHATQREGQNINDFSIRAHHNLRDM